ncbi:MAG: M13 family metallopeptidase [Candidatus Velthaea sp.]
MNVSRFAFRALGALALAALVGTSLQTHAAPVDAAAPLTSNFPNPGLDRANLDPTCKACDDFFQFATGGWQKKHPIPAGYPLWGNASILAEGNRNILHAILDDAAQNAAAPAGSNEQKVGSYYRACMDEAGIESAGLRPLKSELDRIAGISGKDALVAEIAHVQTIGVDAPFAVTAQPDSKNSALEIANVDFGGLGLPDRDFYFRDDPKSKAVRDSYGTYVTQLLVLSGSDAAKAPADAGAIVALEATLAKATPARAALRDPNLTEHKMTFADLPALAPGIDWAQYAKAIGAPAISTVNVDLPDFVKMTDGLLTSIPLDTWKAYLRYHLIDAYASTLPKAFVDASFAFRSTALNGVKDQLPRWKRCSAATDRALGDALGQVYVAKVFPPAAKARIVALVNNLQSTLHDDISTLPWMSKPTQTRAEAKLAAFTKKVGYPDKWRSYANLAIGDGPYATNSIRIREFNSADNVARIGKPTDRTRWGITTATVNAYYSPENNEIVFPAGILAPPFFSASTDDAVNYGAIGAIIGHEMTHGFDDQGRQFDETGNLSDWWQPSDTANFNTRAQCIIDQFDSYEVGGVHINGKLVTGEAIADLGGLTVAYKAFEKTSQAKAHKIIDGYTPEQRFFLSFANAFASNEHEEVARNRALTDPHPDNKYRVIGTLSNMPEFRKAFGCVTGDKMVRANACQIW